MRRRQQQEEGANEKREEREALEWKQGPSGAAGAGAGAGAGSGAGEGDKNGSTPRNEDVEEAKKVSLETQFMLLGSSVRAGNISNIK